MSLPRFRIRDDRELEQVAGIAPADHRYVTASAETIEKMERRILGAEWFKPRKKEEADESS